MNQSSTTPSSQSESLCDSKHRAEFHTRVVGVDPGSRNLAYVIFDVCTKTDTVQLVNSVHADVGVCKTDEDVIARVWSNVNFYRPFDAAHYVIIEDQKMGKYTRPRNQGLAWLLGTMVLEQCAYAQLKFKRSKDKFTAHKDLMQLDRVLAREVVTGKRKKIKNNAIHLAFELLIKYKIDPNTVFIRGNEKQWEHLADAIGLASLKIKEIMPLSPLPPLAVVLSSASTAARRPSSCR